MILKNQWLHFSVPIIASQLLFYPWLLYCVIVKITTLFERREKWLQIDSMEEPGEQSAVVFALIVTGPAGSDNVCVASPPPPHPLAVGEFINPWLGDKVDSGIEFSYPARQPMLPCSLAGRYDNPMPELTLSPQSGSMNSATGSVPIDAKTTVHCSPDYSMLTSSLP
jgi:hypothetical protein